MKVLAEMELKNHRHESARPQAYPQPFEYPSLPLQYTKKSTRTIAVGKF